VEYIPLETKKESLLGAIGRLIITDSSIVAYDNDTKCIFFFEPDGKYIKKIKVASGYYPSISLNSEENRLFVYLLSLSDSKKGSFMKLTLRGDNVGKPEDLELRGTGNPYSLGGDFYFQVNTCSSVRSGSIEEGTENLVNIYKKDSLYKTFLPIRKDSNLLFCSSGFGSGNVNVDNRAIYFSRFLYNDVYKLTKDSAVKTMQFIFPLKNSLPANVLYTHNFKTVDSTLHAMLTNRDLIIGIQNIKHINGHALTFNLMYRNPVISAKTETGNQYNFFYNIQTKKLVSFERLSPDSLSQYLPVIEGSTISAINGLLYYNGYFYSDVSSLKLFSAIENNKHDQQYSLKLQKYFATQNRKSNPVIVKMKLKELSASEF
jgi:hypothetical protein